MRKILSNKLFLYLTEFFAGMSVMAVELGASRLLAPYFSSSQIVWTIIIGTIMIAMALGNIYGGRKADRDPNPDKLYGRILIAAIWIAAIPVLGKFAILGISGLLIFAVNTNLLIWAALFACLVLFVFPLFLLGTVTPSLIKYSLDSLETSGSIAGRLGAFNTIGSIIGTFLPTFVTIPAVGTSVTFLIFAGVLLALAAIYFLSGKGGKIKLLVAAICVIVCCILGARNSFAFWENDLVYEGESVYNYLQVKETPSQVILSTNVLFGVQSVHVKTDGLTGMYYDYALAAPLFAGAAEKDELDVLILGNGTGTYATFCERFFPHAEVEGVEIDGKIIDLATEYFEQPADIAVAEYDGRAFLNTVDKRYDVIMVDAFRDITIPFQMSSVEFFTMVREHLTDDGVMVVNLNMYSDGEDSINAYLKDTIASVFADVRTIRVPYATNSELFASMQPLDADRLLAAAQTYADADDAAGGASEALRQDLRTTMSDTAARLEKVEGGDRILTDDKAPVELLGMKEIDNIIKEELAHYREMIRNGEFSLGG